MKHDSRILFNRDAKFTTTTTDKGMTLEGYAIVWNVPSTDRGGFTVKLMPNSASFETPTFALVNHNYDLTLARNDDGTLTLTPDGVGVKAKIVLPTTTLGKDTAINVSTGLIRGMSFALMYDGAEFHTETDDDGNETMVYTKFRCNEVTITPIPAFTQSSIGVSNQSELVATNKLLANEQKAEATIAWDQNALRYEKMKLEAYIFSKFNDTLAEFQLEENKTN